jgi:hypothetical protein
MYPPFVYYYAIIILCMSLIISTKKLNLEISLTMKVMILGDWVGQDAHTIFR